MRIRESIVAVSAAMTGCATIGTNTDHYLAPSGPSGTVTYGEIIAEPFDKVWRRLVSNISSSSLAVDHINKASRLITLTFHSGSPERYIDCGTTDRDFSFNGEQEHYSYEVAADAVFKYADSWGPHDSLPVVVSVTHKTSLNARMNIHLAPFKIDKTRVSVNVHYTFNEQVDGDAGFYNAHERLVTNRKLHSKHYTAAFSTAHPAKKNAGSTDQPYYVTCASMGALEKTILDLAKPPTVAP